jgi:hypothetical protein
MERVYNFSISSTRVASAGIISAPQASASLLICPMRIAIGALVNVNVAPSSFAFKAIFQAIDFSSNAPEIIPFFPLIDYKPLSGEFIGLKFKVISLYLKQEKRKVLIVKLQIRLMYINLH